MSLHKENKPVVLEHGIKGYDTRDIVGKKMAVAFAILAIVTIISAFTALWTWKSWEGKRSSGEVAVLPVAEDRTLPALPRLQPMPQIDIKALHAEERTKLGDYAWIDKKAQIVQIPVSRAMEIIAEKGLPHGREAHVPGQGQTPAAPGPVVAH